MNNELPKYRSHKIVGAAKIIAARTLEQVTMWEVELSTGQSEYLPFERVPKGTDPVGGYFVRYQDRYASWSPREAFEGGYTLLEDRQFKVLDPGYRYELTTGQILQFLKRAPVQPGSAEAVTVADGTINEEVLAVLIDRLQHLDSLHPCRENAIAMTHLETALLWLKKRTEDRMARGVEGRAVS